MVNIKNIIMSMFVVMMVMCFCVGCSSPDKPSEEEMKNTIMAMELGGSDKLNTNRFLKNRKFNTFRITNAFFLKEKGVDGESNPYCIEVDYKISFTVTSSKSGYSPGKQEVIRNNLQLQFVKKDGKWHVVQR